MIYRIRCLRANLVRKEIEDDIQRLFTPRFAEWNIKELVSTPNLFKVNPMLRRLERVRRQRWAPWKDQK